MGFHWRETPLSLKKRNLWKKTESRKQNLSGTVPRASRREKEPMQTPASQRAPAKRQCTSTNQVNPVSDSCVLAWFSATAPSILPVSSGAGRGYSISPCPALPGSTNRQPERDLLGERRREIVLLVLVGVKRRENPQFLACIARVDVGCSTVEMAANRFPCDRQLRVIQEIPYKQSS